MKVGEIRQIPYGPAFQILAIDGDEALCDFFEQAEVETCHLLVEEVLKCPLKD